MEGSFEIENWRLDEGFSKNIKNKVFDEQDQLFFS